MTKKRDIKPVDLGNWTTQMRKGLLELCIVNMLAQGEVYAYDLVKKLAATRGVVVTEGTVYPLLSRLKRAGLVTARLEESSAGAARKYYSLTKEGERARASMNEYWRELSAGMEEILESEDNR